MQAFNYRNRKYRATTQQMSITYFKLQENKIFGLSINYKNIDDKLIKNFKNIEIFAWTVNNRKTADYLAKIGVQNIVSDKIL